MLCHKCGTKSVGEAKFCASCGAALEQPKESESSVTQERVQEKINAPEDAQSSTNADTASTGVFLRRLTQGDFGLARTYWLYTVVVGVVVVILSKLLFYVTHSWGLSFAYYFVIGLPYQIIIWLSLWRAATKYTGPKAWAVLTKIICVLGFIAIATLTFFVVKAAFKDTGSSQPTSVSPSYNNPAVAQQNYLLPQNNNQPLPQHPAYTHPEAEGGVNFSMFDDVQVLNLVRSIEVTGIDRKGWTNTFNGHFDTWGIVINVTNRNDFPIFLAKVGFLKGKGNCTSNENDYFAFCAFVGDVAGKMSGSLEAADSGLITMLSKSNKKHPFCIVGFGIRATPTEARNFANKYSLTLR